MYLLNIPIQYAEFYMDEIEVKDKDFWQIYSNNL